MCGYAGDGESGCVDVDECWSDNGGCDALTSCTNTAGGRVCGSCPSGYTGDGESGCVATETDSFETWPGSWTSGSGTGGSASASCAHDGGSGLCDTAGAWYYRDDISIGVGTVLSIWVRAASSGRFYFGFDATSSGSKSFVMATNTGDIRFQENTTWGYTELNTSAQTYVTDRWYRMEIEIQSGTTAMGRLFDQDGTTLLNSVTQAYSSIGSGGLALRSFGGFAIDSLEVR